MQKDEIFLKDYLKPNFNVSSLFLEFEIADDFTIVTSIGEYEKNNSNSKELELDGTNQELLEITLGGNVLSNTDYALNDSKLKIFNVPNKFSLKIKQRLILSITFQEMVCISQETSCALSVRQKVLGELHILWIALM